MPSPQVCFWANPPRRAPGPWRASLPLSCPRLRPARSHLLHSTTLLEGNLVQTHTVLGPGPTGETANALPTWAQLCPRPRLMLPDTADSCQVCAVGNTGTPSAPAGARTEAGPPYASAPCPHKGPPLSPRTGQRERPIHLSSSRQHPPQKQQENQASCSPGPDPADPGA